MKYLLDTHTFLWSIAKSDRLSDKIKSILKNRNNEIYVSSVTFWEISIKCRLNKLDLDGYKPEDLLSLAEKMDFQLVGLSPEDASTYFNLQEGTHKDPFDRMLIWQSIQRNFHLISDDSEFYKFEEFGLKLVW